ncbi:hypothetical protein F4780DRAFT_35574 [Xylariomycetidae sp. FL0641]|nr:hypothetical protein F4780DRAFT_35574 [Xylariomycetidae sp. FL0641]
MVFRKKEVYTVITPIPGYIPRQLAIDILHSHGEVITLNPLVLGYKKIDAPRDAASDEYFSTWYEITERIQYVPGMGRMGSGKLSFKGCFHDLPWGLQTHIPLPMGVDMRNKYRIGGNQPGFEPPEPPEIGLEKLGVPKEGLYLREDIEIKCNIALVSMIKAQMKQASKDMVQRIIKKAELLDSGALRAMIEDGKMKTYKPGDDVRTQYTGGLAEGMRSPQLSPASPYQPPVSPSTPYRVPRPVSMQPTSMRPGTSDSLGYPAHWQQQQQQQMQMDERSRSPYQPMPMDERRKSPALPPHPQQYAELANHPGHVSAPATNSFTAELPGDFSHPQVSPHLQPPQPSPTIPYGGGRASSSSAAQSSPDPNSGTWRWSHGSPPSMTSSRPSSYSDASSPTLEQHKQQQQTYAAELATHRETLEEHHNSNTTPGHVRKTSPLMHQVRQGLGGGSPGGYNYNPADYR